MRQTFNISALGRLSAQELHALKRALEASSDANRYAHIQLVEQALRLK